MRRIALLVLVLTMIPFGSRVLAQQMVRLVGNHPANPPAAGVLEAPTDLRVSLSIGFVTKNSADLDAFLQGQNDPASPWYHQALGKGEFVKRFGPTPTEYRAVIDWLKSEGFEITSDETPKMYIWCIGTVAQAEAAFQIKIVKLPTGAFWNLDDPAIPEQFSGLIESIVGLDNLYAMKQRFKSSSGAIGFGPADIASFYSLQPLAAAGVDGTGSRCVAVIGISDFLDDAISQFTGGLMIDAVRLYDGYIVQSTGDGIFALFGAPVADEHHPQRALYAALRMQEEVRRYADRTAGHCSGVAFSVVLVARTDAEGWR